MRSWLLGVIAVVSVSCGGASSGAGTPVAGSVVDDCGMKSGDVSSLPTDLVTLQGKGLVLLLEFQSNDGMQGFADGLMDLGMQDPAFRDAVLDVNFAGVPDGTQLVAEFPETASLDDVCVLYTLLLPHASGLANAVVVDMRA